jgi:hypothetical protein
MFNRVHDLLGAIAQITLGDLRLNSHGNIVPDGAAARHSVLHDTLQEWRQRRLVKISGFVPNRAVPALPVL